MKTTGRRTKTKTWGTRRMCIGARMIGRLGKTGAKNMFVAVDEVGGGEEGVLAACFYFDCDYDCKNL